MISSSGCRTRTLIQSAERFLGKDTTTPAMAAAYDEWFSLYFQRKVTKEEDPCQRLPYAIVSKLSRTVFSEYSASVASNAKDANSAWQEQNLNALEALRKDAMQWALVGGEVLLKPVPGKNHFSFTVIRRDHYLVLGRDAAGKITGVGTAERSTQGGLHYTLLERRELDASGYLSIHNCLYQSSDANMLGLPVQLSTLPRYAGLVPEYTFPEPMGSVGLIQLRVPMANCVDGSGDAISVYEPAVTLIHNINRNERQLDAEFDNSRNRIVVSRDLVKKDIESGKMGLDSDLFIAIPEDPLNMGITTYNPTIRDASYERRKQSYLRSAETLIGFKRGILSEVEAVERTAKEITSSEGDYSLTVIDFQNAWYDTTQECLRVCDALGRMYAMPAAGSWNSDSLAMSWGNGILYDPDTKWQELLDMVRSRLLKAEIALAWKYDLPWETEQDLALIRKKYMPELEEML